MKNWRFSNGLNRAQPGSTTFDYLQFQPGLSVNLLMFSFNGQETPFFEAQAHDSPAGIQVAVELILHHEATLAKAHWMAIIRYTHWRTMLGTGKTPSQIENEKTKHCITFQS